MFSSYLQVLFRSVVPFFPISLKMIMRPLFSKVFYYNSMLTYNPLHIPAVAQYRQTVYVTASLLMQQMICNFRMMG